jgi:hypothetical protein
MEREKSRINMFLTDIPIDNGLGESYQGLPGFPNNQPELTNEHCFHRTISDLEKSTAKGLPPLSIIGDAMHGQYSVLPTPQSADIYWSYDPAFFNPDPNLYFYADQRFDLNNDVYHSPVSPRMIKKRKSEGSANSAAPTSVRKKTIVNICECSGNCGKKVASMFLRGPIHLLQKSFMIDILCNNCTNQQPWLYHDSKLIKSCDYVQTARKRCIENLNEVECDVCRMKIGNGGIRPVDLSGQISQDLTVEYVCNKCIVKYKFCSECGGGGKCRTGKWRPIELFEKGRRTCILPHIRLGDSEVSTVSYSQAELTGEIIRHLQDVFFDSYLSYYAGPFNMELKNQSFLQLLEETIYPLWQNRVLKYISSPPPKHISRYTVVEWINKQHRNKAKAKAQKEEGISFWLKVIADQSFKIKLNFESAADNLGNNTCVSFGVVEWNHKKRVVVIPQIIPRSFFTRSFQAYDHLITQAINSIRIEARRDSISMPIYVVIVGNLDNLKVKGIPERLGFLEKAKFVLGDPDSERLLEDFDHPMRTPNALIHVATVEHLLHRKGEDQMP